MGNQGIGDLGGERGGGLWSRLHDWGVVRAAWLKEEPKKEGKDEAAKQEAKEG